MSDPSSGAEQPFQPSRPSQPSDEGEPPPGLEPETPSGDQKWHPMAIVALVLSVGGFILLGLLGIAGFVLGVIALLQISGDPERYRGKGLAIAAIVLGVIDVGVGLLV